MTIKPNCNKPIVMIVDNDVSVCRAMSRLLWARGYDVHAFASGLEFIEQLSANPCLVPACVVLDMELPMSNGLAVQQRLASIRTNVPVVFLTGRDDAWMRAQALAAGAVRVFQKPLHDEMDEFLNTLDAVAKARR